jgi:hypothetical protein
MIIELPKIFFYIPKQTISKELPDNQVVKKVEPPHPSKGKLFDRLA